MASYNKSLFGLNYLNTTNNTTILEKDSIFFKDINSTGTINTSFDVSIYSSIYSDNISCNSIETNNDVYIDSCTVTNNTHIINNITSLNLITENISISSIITSNTFISSNINVNSITVSNNLHNINNITVTNNLNTLSDIICDTVNLNIGNMNNLDGNNITVNTIHHNDTNITINNYLSFINVETNNINCTFISCNNNFLIDNSTNNNIICNNNSVSDNINVTKDCVSNSMDLSLIINKLNEYPDNDTAVADSVPFNSLYRSADIVKVCIDHTNNIILNGNDTITIYENESYTDEGATISNNTENYTLSTIGTVKYGKRGIYNIHYRAIDGNNYVKMSKSRKIIIYAIPEIYQILYNSTLNNIHAIIYGIYNKITLTLTNDGNTIVSETEIPLPYMSFDSQLTITGTPYICTIKVKKSDNTVLATKTLEFSI